jgi:hypothetical protein
MRRLQKGMAHRSISYLGPAIALALATAAAAQPAPPAPPGANVVSGVAVVSTDPPKVTAAWPAAGAAVAPGVLVLKIVFDQPMTADQWSYAKGAAGEYPNCLPTPRLLADRKTFVLLCSTLAGKSYGVQINATDARGFVNVGDRRAPVFDLGFTTSNAEPVRTVKAAMKLAGLGDLDMPVESMGSFVHPAPAAAPAP